MQYTDSRLRIVAALLALVPAPAMAELPAPVRAMVDAALATGDTAKVDTVIAIAKQTNPDDTDELDKLHDGFVADQARLAQQKARDKEQRIRNAGVFQQWSGKGQIGAFQSSGNSNNMGVSLALSLERTGIDWQHRLKFAADYQRSNGVTSTENYLASYEPRYQISHRLFSYGLMQYEQDRFQGFSARYSFSGGLGYKVVDSKALKLSLQAGPSWRHVDYIDGGAGQGVGALAGMNLGWKFAKNLTFTQDANLVADGSGGATVIVDSTSTTAVVTSGLEAKINNHLTTRLAYTLDYNSSPAAGAVSTDTTTRFTLVYGF